MAQFAVIGLGSFGATVAQELTKLNHDVIGIDTVKECRKSCRRFNSCRHC